MIRLIIFVAKKFTWANKLIENFIQAYRLSFPQIEAPKQSKEYFEELCKNDLKKVAAYEKLGSKSGLPKPKTVHQPH